MITFFIIIINFSHLDLPETHLELEKFLSVQIK